MLIDVALTGYRNGVRKEAYNILKIYRSYNINSANVECESKSDTGNTRGNENHLKITQKIPEQHKGEARNQGTIKNNHNEHCTHTAESADVKVHNIFNMRNNITCTTNCKCRTAATLSTLKT
jgi:hypothetical protein